MQDMFQSTLRCLIKIIRDFSVVGIASYVLFKIYVRFYLDRYHLVGKVADLRIYPVVSCGPIQVSNAECSPSQGLTAYGIQDKALVVCKKNKYPHPMLAYGEYRQISIRNHARIEIELNTESIRLTEPKGTSVSFNPSTLIESYPKKRRVQLVCVKSIYSGYFVNDTQLTKWFEKTLVEPKDSEIQVVHRTKILWDKLEGRTILGNLVVMNGESIVAVLRKDTDSVENKMNASFEQFCPNVVISGCRPFTENNWKTIIIGRQCYGEVTGPDIKILDKNHENMYDDDMDMVCLDTGEAVEEYPDVKFVCGLKRDRTIGVHVDVKVAGEIAVGDPVYAVYKRPESTLKAYLNDLYQHWSHYTKRNTFKESSHGVSISKSFSFQDRAGMSYDKPTTSTRGNISR